MSVGDLELHDGSMSTVLGPAPIRIASPLGAIVAVSGVFLWMSANQLLVK